MWESRRTLGFEAWLEGFADRKTQAVIGRSPRRIEFGAFGDVK